MSADPRLARIMRAGAAASKTPPIPPPPPPRQGEPSPTNGISSSAQPPLVTNGASEDGPFKLKFCTVCASNNNRSMEGHLRLAAAQYPVVSFGTGSLVRLPGPSIHQPNVYNFNEASYDQMYAALDERDPRLYRANGILNMLERNRGVKHGPERWQDWHIGEPRRSHANDQGSTGSEGGIVDIVITCEERCWDAVIDDLLNRGSPLDRPVHVFNIDIKDSHEEALIGGKAIVDLAGCLNKAAIEERDASGDDGWEEGRGSGREGFDARVPDILADWQQRWPQFPSLWTMAWF